jgi:hypothetical protein
VSLCEMDFLGSDDGVMVRGKVESTELGADPM